MAYDTPAKIAILGAGPLGLETGLYARFLGYEVQIFEAERVCEHVQRSGHVELFTPFSMNRSPLGLAAIQAQSPDLDFPSDDTSLTGQQWFDAYLSPLSNSDLISDCIELETRVLSVGRLNKRVKNSSRFVKSNDSVTDEDSETMEPESDADETMQQGFQILVRKGDGSECCETADIVIDTTGVFGNPNWIGPDGIPAIGERKLRRPCAPATQPSPAGLEFGIPNFKGMDRERYARKNVLLIGSGYSAATNIVAVSELVSACPETEVTWITSTTNQSEPPIQELENDPLKKRLELAKEANRLADGENPNVRILPGTRIQSIEWQEEQPKIGVRWCNDNDNDEHEHEHENSSEDNLEQTVHVFDQLIANVGHHGDSSLYDQLHVQADVRFGGPVALAPHLDDRAQQDCLFSKLEDPKSLLTEEPNFYILGSKSYGRRSSFLFQHGLKQIQLLFSLIGDREGLDLYQNLGNLNS